MAEKDYLAIARKKVRRPADVEGYRKILVYGRNKKGKSTFALSSGIETTIVLDPEYGTDTMKSKNPYVLPIEKWEDVQEYYGALRTGNLSPKTLGQGDSDDPFTWVSVDGLTRINNMALKYVMKVAEERDLDRRPGMVTRQDYGKSGELMKQMLANFQTLRMNVCYTAQERMMTGGSGDDDEDDSSAYYVPDLPAAVRSSVNALVEVIGRIYTTRVQINIKGGGTKEKIERRLQIGLHERYDTGYRSDFELPDMMRKPTLPKLTNLMLTGKETA